MNWLEQSHMARRGVARGRLGARHSLTEALQGEYHYVYGPYSKPVLRINPGDVVEVETQ
jgi:amidase